MVVAAIIFGALLFWIALALYWLAPEITYALFEYFDFSDMLLLTVIAALLAFSFKRAKHVNRSRTYRLR
jgi:hypothetical protein